jgi:hypothetical protein
MSVTTLRNENCGGCHFWRRNGITAPDGTAFGACCQEPPKVFLLGVVNPQMVGQNPRPVTDSFWPTLPANGWCGRFQPSTHPQSFAGIDLSKLGEEGTA